MSITLLIQQFGQPFMDFLQLVSQRDLQRVVAAVLIQSLECAALTQSCCAPSPRFHQLLRAHGRDPALIHFVSPLLSSRFSTVTMHPT
ncbi:MAG: hypothetical protein MJZ81_07810 [Bacteroidales bacterium]|nr:hypothetical protein [Bacteroidales bacterium]